MALLTACPGDDPGTKVDMSTPDVEADMSGDLPVTVSLDSVVPSEGPVEGGTLVTLTGNGFAEGMTVRFGAAPAVDADVASGSEATATTPASTTAGAVTVVVENTDGGTDALAAGFTYTGDTGPTIDFCMIQANGPWRSAETVASPPIYVAVYAEGVTQGAGQGAGVEVEVGWGSDDAVEGFTYAPTTFNIDIDGLGAGDLANDEYGGTITIPTAGTYRYAARARLDGGTWLYCDLDGSDNGTSSDQLGTITIVAAGELVDSCYLRFPHIVPDSMALGTLTFFGRVVEEGVTGTATERGAIPAQLVVGPPGMDPAADIAPFTLVAARLNPNATDLLPGEDAYVATYAPSSAGERAFAFRFSADGGMTWSYCGLQDVTNPSGVFAPDKMGALFTSASPNPIDFCHVWQDTLTDDADTATQPIITVEVYEDPVTVGNGGVNNAQIEVEAAALPLEINPAWSTVAWNPLPYKDLRPGEPNNYEYEGAVYTAATHPAAGAYNVVARVREVGATIWRYCDTDEAAPRFRLEASTPLTISP